jgi:hypothetical protein
MGYRSDVAFVVPTTAPRFENLTDDKFFAVVEEKEEFRLYICNSVKWDNEYTIPKAVNKYLKSIQSEEFKFIRIGDYTEDMVEKGELDYDPFDIGIERKIQYVV